MTPEFKAQWVAALRSGEYEQARDAMRIGDSFCCLGVAAQLADPSKWKDWEGFLGQQGWGGDYPTSFVALARRIGLPLDFAKELALRNDGAEPYNRKHSFEEIADIIESTDLIKYRREF